jgi:flagellar P-ring protein precursor FlgI
MQLKNVAAVMVTAQLPPLPSPARRSTSTSRRSPTPKSLRGGTLIATPLKGADGQIYALAQGNLIVGGAGASAAARRCRSTT